MRRERANAYFETFEHTAFRLETRDVYIVGTEQERFERFVAGEREDDRHPAHFDDFRMLIRRLTGEGKRMERVRLVTEPLTEYSRWLLHVTQHNVAAGEDVRYLSRSEAEQLGITYDHDYWLFDSQVAQLFNFDGSGRVVGRELVEEPATIVSYSHIRDAVWHYAVKWEVFVDKHGLR